MRIMPDCVITQSGLLECVVGQADHQ